MVGLLKRTWLIFVLAVIAVAAGWYYLSTRPPPGVDPMSGTDTTIATITALATAIVSLGGAIGGVAMKVIDFRKQSLELKVKELELAVKTHELDLKKRELDQS